MAAKLYEHLLHVMKMCLLCAKNLINIYIMKLLKRWQEEKNVDVLLLVWPFPVRIIILKCIFFG